MAISPKRDTGSDKDPLTVTMPRPWVLVLLQVLVVSPMYMIGWLSPGPAWALAVTSLPLGTLRPRPSTAR
jgi:hypothetical protein